ncbi:MAG: hypothetical protein Q4C74_04970 [Rothia sp. (in: high G+C Gram-positive bacteria)]|nr:hypothetical protein [Rothia sp. (in: high G+C Gram-positive bacteria)]
MSQLLANPEPEHKHSWLTRRRWAIRYVRTRMHMLISIAGRKFFVFSLLMRLPSWMLALATLVIMADRTGEITLGAYAAGLICLSSAMSHRSYRALAQRLSQRTVMFMAATCNIPAVAFLLAQTLSFQPNRLSGSLAYLMLAAALAGITTAPLGALMRSYWSHNYSVNKDRRLLNAATAFESLLDVIALPLAAAIVGIISVLAGLNAPLYTVIAIDVLGLLFILRYPESIRMDGSTVKALDSMSPVSRPSQRLGWLPMLGISCLGICLGATQTLLVLRSITQDSPVHIGFLLASMGGSGALACLALNVLRLRLATWQGWLFVAACLTLSSLLLSIPTSSAAMLLVLMLFGAVLGVGLMCIDAIITSISVHGNVDLAQSTTQATYIAGLALGYVWSGVFGSHSGVQSALLVPAIAATVFFVIGHIYGYQWRKLYEERLKPRPEDLTLKPSKTRQPSSRA